jgi:hypothetical protein
MEHLLPPLPRPAELLNAPPISGKRRFAAAFAILGENPVATKRFEDGGYENLPENLQFPLAGRVADERRARRV